MNEIVKTSDKYEIVLTNNFDGMMKRFNEAHGLSKLTACATQIYASWIVYNALWANKTDDYYIDHRTGEVHKSFDNAPDDVKPRLMLRHKRKFNTQTDFFEYLLKVMPDFNISTFWSRHRTILKRIEVWRKAHNNAEDMPEEEFMSIVEDVVLYGKRIDDVIINGIFEIKKAKKGIPAEILDVTSRVDRKRLGIEDDLNDEEALKEVASVVLDKLIDAHDMVRSGAYVKDVTAELRSELLNESSINFIAYGSDIILKYTPGSDGNIIPTIKYKMRFENDRGEIVELADMNSEVVEWLERHLRVTIRGLR